MSADYKKQYRPEHLEPFWPNEIAKMMVVVLCTLAVIMFLAVLPVLLDLVGIHGALHAEEPADPHGATPLGIKPEWYFLCVYQYLRLMPTQLAGISGKTIGVLSQGPLMLAVLLLPFWYRKRAHAQPGRWYVLVISVAIVAFLFLTIIGGWPEIPGPPTPSGTAGEPEHATMVQYLQMHWTMFACMAAAAVVFVSLMIQEQRAVSRVLGPPETRAQNLPPLDPFAQGASGHGPAQGASPDPDHPQPRENKP